jgi:hypothetical protein
MAKRQMAKWQMAKRQMAKWQMAKRQMAKRQMAKRQMAKRQMAKWQMAKWQMAKWQMAKWQMAKWQMAKWQMAKGQMAEWRVAKWRVAKWQVAKWQMARGTSMPSAWSPWDGSGSAACRRWTQAVKYDKTTPPRRRAFGWLRRTLLEDISVAFQRAVASIMQTFRATFVPALVPVGVGAAAQAMPDPAGRGAGPGRGTVGMVMGWRSAGTGPSTGGCEQVLGRDKGKGQGAVVRKPPPPPPRPACFSTWRALRPSLPPSLPPMASSAATPWPRPAPPHRQHLLTTRPPAHKERGRPLTRGWAARTAARRRTLRSRGPG